jgi:hypothetical protein
VALGVGRMVRLRLGQEVIETLDTVRFDHLLRFAHGTGKSLPGLEALATHRDAQIEIDAPALVEEMQQLAQSAPPEDLAPLIGLLRNDATRIQHLAARLSSGR